MRLITQPACDGSRAPAAAIVAALCVSVGCGAGSDPLPAVSLPSESPRGPVWLASEPVYLAAVATGERVYAYVETEDAGGLMAQAIALGPDGTHHSALEILFEGSVAPFGEPTVDPSGALLAATLGAPETEGADPLWELWRWHPPTPPERLASCALPRPRTGDLLVDGAHLYTTFQTADGALHGFRTTLLDPDCPAASRIVQLAAGPLPEGYRVDSLGGALALSGQLGESYSIRLFDPELAPLRHLRLANGAVPDAGDLRVVALPEHGPTAVYAARIDGARDIYLARLTQLRAGPLRAERVVASAESERAPRLWAHGDRLVVQWSVIDGDERIELAGLVPSHDVALPGGEVLWRQARGDGGQYALAWTAEGLLRLWTDVEGGRVALRMETYVPSFW